MELVDRYGRTLDYLRLSVTDRCNLRCYYCMPEEGMVFANGNQLLTWDELYFLSSLFTGLGVSKMRITGGEPFVRNGLLPFLKNVKALEGMDEITITTNASLTGRYIQELKELGITKLNISLDSLDAQRFYNITRRNVFSEVYQTVFHLLQEGFDIKLNCVLSASKNIDDIIPFIELTKHYHLSVRFLEEMPFNGVETFDNRNWNYKDIHRHISLHYDEITTLINEPNSTSVNYAVPGYKGSFGIIPSFSRTFCGTCNRVRLSATGELRTCLYGAPAVNLRDELRSGASEEELEQIIINAVQGRERDGFAAEKKNMKSVHDSMSVLGG